MIVAEPRAVARASALAIESVAWVAPGGRAILSDVSLDVSPGERLAVIGPNGAGKSTLLKLLFGLLRPTRGQIRLDGVALRAMSAQQRALRVAVVAQSDHPDLRLTLQDYVELGRLPHRGRVDAGEHRRVVASALALTGLAHLSRRELESLSGGERQRGAIARAVAQSPSLLLLDEPTNHLDPRARADILALVGSLGITVIAVLHDLALVAPFADRVAVLREGRLAVVGPPSVALAPALVRSVFDMDCFSALNPTSGREVLVFDAPIQRECGREEFVHE